MILWGYHLTKIPPSCVLLFLPVPSLQIQVSSYKQQLNSSVFLPFQQLVVSNFTCLQSQPKQWKDNVFLRIILLCFYIVDWIHQVPISTTVVYTMMFHMEIMKLFRKLDACLSYKFQISIFWNRSGIILDLHFAWTIFYSIQLLFIDKFLIIYYYYTARAHILI